MTLAIGEEAPNFQLPDTEGASGTDPVGRIPSPARTSPASHSRNTSAITRPARLSMRARRPDGSASTWEAATTA